MEDFEKLLAYIRRTNQEMTRDRLIYELYQSRYSSFGLISTWRNIKDKGYAK